jgi:hypothetical protein
MEREMCSYLEWQLNVEPTALKDFESMIRRDFKGPAGPYPTYIAPLPAPPSGPFAHPKPSTSNIPTAIPSFGPGAPPSPPTTTSSSVPPEKRRSSADSYPAPADHTHLPTPPSLHSDVSSPANSVSPVTPADLTCSTAKIVSSAGSSTMQIGDNASPPYHHAHTRKSSSPIPAHQKRPISLDTKYTSPKKIQHAAPAKSNTVYAFARPCVW